MSFFKTKQQKALDNAVKLVAESDDVLLALGSFAVAIGEKDTALGLILGGLVHKAVAAQEANKPWWERALDNMNAGNGCRW